MMKRRTISSFLQSRAVPRQLSAFDAHGVPVLRPPRRPASTHMSVSVSAGPPQRYLYAASMGAPDRPVVIAYDGSHAARQAVLDAAEILRPCSALIVTVWEAGLALATLPMSPDGMTMSPSVDPAFALSVDREVHQQAENVSRDGAALAHSVGLDARPLAVPEEGSVSETILNVTRSNNAAAIVIGSRGLSGLRARLEGSTSKGLLKHARCPVIVVHESDDERA